MPTVGMRGAAPKRLGMGCVNYIALQCVLRQIALGRLSIQAGDTLIHQALAPCLHRILSSYTVILMISTG
jgi:hypothetical protein